jgi:hypothetical protein
MNHAILTVSCQQSEDESYVLKTHLPIRYLYVPCYVLLQCFLSNYFAHHFEAI